MNALRKAVPEGINLVAQGEYVAESLKDYLRRHPEMDEKCSKGGTIQYYTTESEERFKEIGKNFLHNDIIVNHINLQS